MARELTIQDIVDGGRIKADDTEKAIADDDLIIPIVSSVYAHYFRQRIISEPDAYRATQTIDHGDALPDDYFATIGVDYNVAGQCPFELTRLQEHERNDYSQSTSFGHAVKYRIGAGVIELFPTPPDSQTYTHIYLSGPPLLTLSDTPLAVVVDVRTGHEEYLFMLLARQLKVKEESYQGEWDADIEKFEKDLQMAAQLRYFNDTVTAAVGSYNSGRGSRNAFARRRRW